MITLKPAVLWISTLALAAGLSAQALVKVGETAETRIETPHPVRQYWQQEIRIAGSSFLKVHLAKLELGTEDELLVLDGQGLEVYRRKGPAREGLWLPSVDGDTLTLEVWPASGSFPWGLSVDQVGHGYPGALEAVPVPESICGTNDQQDAACYASDAGKTTAGNAVGKMLFQEGGSWYLCTGALVSAGNHFLTCNHCIADEAGAQSLQVSWKYQYSGCGSGTLGTDSTSNGAHLIKTDADLDYSLLQFSSDTPAARYGYLTLNSGVPQVGEVMWIPQHPSGLPKKYAVNSDMDHGLAKVQAVGLDGAVVGQHTDIGYYADTQGGSSGSPVLDSSNTMIALHHYGLAGTTCQPSDMNQGVEMALIYPQIASYLTQAGLAATASASPVSGAAPLAVAFTATATGGTPPYTYDWAFGDGSAHSSLQNPSHTYTSAGTYSVTLTVHDSASGSAADSHLSITVTPPAALSAQAGASSVAGPAPLAVTFTGVASGGTPPYTYAWDFGDGLGGSTSQNPVHTFSAAGTFPVTFTVHDGAGGTATDTHLSITVTNLLVASASASVTSGNTPLAVTFTGGAAGGTAPYTYDWDFGDGSAHSSAQSPSHAYSTAGTFTVTLTVHDGASAVATDSHIHIHTTSPPVIASVTKMTDPFRLKVLGTNLHPNCTVMINGVAAPATTWKSATQVIAKKGAALKAMCPKGTPVMVTVVNNDDGGVSTSFSFVR